MGTTPGPGERADNPASDNNKLYSILMVVLMFISFTACAIIYIYIGPTTSVDTSRAVLKAEEFTNPYEGTFTTNGGGWEITIDRVSGQPVRLDLLVIDIYPKCGYRKTDETLEPWVIVHGVASSRANLTHDGTTQDWYLHSRTNGTPSFFDDGAVKQLDAGSTSDVGPNLNEFWSFENTTFVYLDKDGDGYVSHGDRIFLYTDFDGDGIQEIPGTICITLITPDHKDMGTLSLDT
jgi:hypothetical protein